MKPDAGGPVWFVIFTPGRAMQRTAWWARLLHPGFRHVLACRPIDCDRVQVVNHTGRRLLVDVAPMPAGAFLRQLMDDAGAWVLAASAPEDEPRAMLRGPMTCTEAVKACLGIAAPAVITPRQLARYLTRRGARPVLPISPAAEEPAHGRTVQG